MHSLTHALDSRLSHLPFARIPHDPFASSRDHREKVLSLFKSHLQPAALYRHGVLSEPIPSSLPSLCLIRNSQLTTIKKASPFIIINLCSAPGLPMDTIVSPQLNHLRFSPSRISSVRSLLLSRYRAMSKIIKLMITSDWSLPSHASI